MTREEAIEVLDNYILDFRQPAMFEMMAALKIAIHDMLPVSREQAEKMYSDCSECSDCKLCIWNETKRCNDCHSMSLFKPFSNFCPKCGKPLTDEAVQIVMERWEVLKDGG